MKDWNCCNNVLGCRGVSHHIVVQRLKLAKLRM
nr:MAG TPA: hypothetical protein [Caudoviricetes sp.]